MCGIAGFVGRGDMPVLADMARAIAHRGPDGEGFFTDASSSVFLAHRRLAILDMAGGAQPMANEDGRVQVTFNGEIYNHAQLRAELIAKGHVFRSDHSDTEVLVHGWEEWGESLPERLNGMFAFAVADLRQGYLFLARDRFGKKPLFYAQTRDSFVFASELPALLRHPSVSAELDPLALKKFFAHGFFPAPHTPYRRARKLPGGHWLRLSLDGSSTRIGRYWEFHVEPDEALGRRPEAELAEELRALVDQAVSRRLESDVPLGILLSGGIDSSVILSSMAQHVPAATIQSFSMGFDEPSYDERDYAAQMAKHVGSEHHVEVCRLNNAQAELAGLLSAVGEPLGDPSLLPTWLVCRFARRHVTVALGGDGADELFAGYDPFAALGPTRLWRSVMGVGGTRLAASIAEMLPQSDRNMSLDFKIRRWLQGADKPPGAWIASWMAPLDLPEIARLFGEPAPVEEIYSEALEVWDRAGAEHPVDRALEYFTRLYLTDDILVKTDRASMLPALELRTPFLDNDVVGFAQRLPHRFKFGGGQRKRLLKTAFAGRLPPAILGRRKKGFGMPVSSWLRSMEPPKAGLLPGLDEAWLTGLWAEHAAKKRDWRLALWCWKSLAALKA